MLHVRSTSILPDWEGVLVSRPGANNSAITVLNQYTFPSLQSHSADEDDYGSIMQATMELTQLYGNVRDVLYSGMGSSTKMMLVGSYVKYVDDFCTSINSWKNYSQLLGLLWQLQMRL